MAMLLFFLKHAFGYRCALERELEDTVLTVSRTPRQTKRQTPVQSYT